MDDGSVEITVVLNDALAGALVTSVGRNRLESHRGEYETIGSDEEISPSARGFADGAIIYTAGVTDALLVEAYERARGFRTVLLQTKRRPREFVVLTTRPSSDFDL